MTLWPALLLAAATTLDAGWRGEVRLRGGGDFPVMDVQATPAATLRARSPAWEAALGYAPRFTLRQVDLRASFEMLHAGTASASWRGRRATFEAHADGAYGTESFSSLALQASTGAPPIQRLPATARVSYASLRAGASVAWAASRRWKLTAGVDFLLSGGVDDPSRAAVPFQSGPRAELGAGYALTRADQLLSAVDVSQVTFSSGQDAAVIAASEAWRRALSRRLSSTLRAGAAGALHRGGEDGASIYSVYPVAEAALAWRLPPDGAEVQASVWVEPVVDRLNGRVDERLQAAVGATWSPSPLVAVRARIGAAQSVPWDGAQAVRLALGEAAASVRVTGRLRVEVGTRGALQEPRGASQWIFFVAAVFPMQTLRL